MIHRTLVDATRVARHLDDAAWRLVDCRFDLAAPDVAATAYAAGHLPGAVYAHLDRDLSGPRTGRNGRHPLPAADDFARRVSAWGIGPGVQVVAYDDSNGLFAARLWWMLRAIGHDAVAVLDGGLPAWRAAGLPLSSAAASFAPVRPELGRSFAATVGADELAALLAQRACCLLDARAAERYTGAVEPLDPVAGHVPGARNFPLQRSLDGQGRLLAPAPLARELGSVTADCAATSVICMCGSGVTACHTLLALEVAGRPGGRLYPGSWSEWCSDPKRPVATGPG